MFGYITSKNKITNETINNYKIHSFKNNLFSFRMPPNIYIYIVKNNIILYENNFHENSIKYNHLNVFKWLLKSHCFLNKCFSDTLKRAIIISICYENLNFLKWIKKNKYLYFNQRILGEIADHKNYKILKWFVLNFNLKKIIIVFGKIRRAPYFRMYPLKINIRKISKTIKFKTKNKYLKGYNKN
jgi:hypothetical protein